MFPVLVEVGFIPASTLRHVEGIPIGDSVLNKLFEHLCIQVDQQIYPATAPAFLQTQQPFV